MKSSQRLRPVAGAFAPADPVELPVGPPDIQTQAIADADGVILREPYAISANWRDPTDDKAHLRRQGARTVHGYRRVWTIDSLHTASPKEITERHVKAATRWLDDYQRMFGATSGGPSLDRVDNARPDLDPMGLRILASKRWEEAFLAIGLEDAKITFHVAILNRSIRDTADRWDMNRDKLHGRLCGALGRLAEHYWPPARSEAIVAVMQQISSDGLPGERFGRWR